jgi:hypothetical protein
MGNHCPIGPRPMRLPDGRRLRGYEREQFTEAWELYLPPDLASPPPPPDSKRDSVTDRENTEGNGDFAPVTPESASRSKNGASTIKDAACHGVTDSNPGREAGSEDAPTAPQKTRFEEGEL